MEIHPGDPTSSTAGTISKFTINDLNDDCLAIILNKLPFIDRTRIERVCRRWRHVSTVNWCSYSRKLKIGSDTGRFPLKRGSNAEKNAAVLEDILRRRGPFLEEVAFTQLYPEHFDMGTITRIVQLCPKLKRLDVANLYLDGYDWDAFHDLEGLSFSFSTYPETGELAEVFRKNKRLRRLRIVSTPWCKTEDFDHLDAGQLEYLQLTFCQNFELTDSIADKLADSLLELEYCPHPYERCNVYHLFKLGNLRALTLTMDAGPMEPDFIAGIAQNCQKLERLTLIFLQERIRNQNIIAPLFSIPKLSNLIVTVDKNMMSREKLDKLFRSAPNLKLFIVCTCAVCVYRTGNRLTRSNRIRQDTCFVYKNK